MNGQTVARKDRTVLYLGVGAAGVIGLVYFLTQTEQGKALLAQLPGQQPEPPPGPKTPALPPPPTPTPTPPAPVVGPTTPASGMGKLEVHTLQPNSQFLIESAAQPGAIVGFNSGGSGVWSGDRPPGLYWVYWGGANSAQFQTSAQVHAGQVTSIALNY